VFFTWSNQADARGLGIDRAEGAEFWSEDGKHWIDFESQVFNASLGHGCQSVIDAVKVQADTLAVAHPAAVYETKARLGEALAQVTPCGLDKFFFTLGGAEAIENALKIARMVTGRHKVITRYRSYHGATYGAMSLGGDARRFALEPGISGVIRVEDPYCYRCPWGTSPDVCHRQCVEQIERIIELEGPEHIAAVFVEPITGAAGGYIPPDDYLPALRKLCDKHGIMLVVDEVLTGFGRTGKWFACQHWDVIPDMITMGKGLTGGYAPLGAVAVNERIATHFEKNTLWAGLTSYAHPICCAAGLAAIEAYHSDGLIARAAAMEASLEKHLVALQRDFPVVDGARCKGLYGAFELVRDRSTRVPVVPWNGTGSALEPTRLFRQRLAELGLHVLVRWHTVIIAPPLMISEAVLEQGFERLREALTLVQDS